MTYLSWRERFASKARHYSQVAVTKLLKRGGLIFVITAAMFVITLALSLSGVPFFSNVEARNTALVLDDYSGISRAVIVEAERLSTHLYGRSREADTYMRQLLAAYVESRDKDFLIIFNGGGWGTTGIEEAEDWQSILDGISSDIRTSGYKISSLSFQRTSKSLIAKLNEIKEIVTGYMSKAKELASGIRFLTQFNPDLKIILAGESTGTMICDSTMNLLNDNDRVFSIQTGIPFWQINTTKNRTLLLNDNGLIPDSLNQGDLYTIVVTSIKTALGKQRTPDTGALLGIFSSPGHEYYWDYPGVCSRIENFLQSNFGIRTRNTY